MKRIHIIGSGPRTGTTLLAEVMATCFYIDHFCEHESSICTDEPKYGNCLLTKQPGEIEAVRLPLLLNKDLYVVCIIRDPRDSVVSFHGARPGVYWTGLRWWKLFCQTYDNLAKNPRFIPIKYEEFVSDPDRVQQKLMDKIPFLEKKHGFSEYHLVAKPSESSLKAMRNLRPIEPVGIGNWKKHLPRIKQQIALHGSISDELIKFGYEKDKQWEMLLEGVEQGKFKTSRPEFIRFKDTLMIRINTSIEVANIIVRKLGLDPVSILWPIKKLYEFARITQRHILSQS